MQMKVALTLALIVCSDHGVLAFRTVGDLGVTGLGGGSASHKASAGRRNDGAALAERSAAGLSAQTAALDGGLALQGGGQALDEAALVEQARAGIPGLEDIPEWDPKEFAVEAETLAEVLQQNRDLLMDYVNTARAEARLLSLLARSIFFAPPTSIRRKAADGACAWYLANYGTATDRLGYAVARSVRWAAEHPKAAAAGAAATLGATLFAVWYRRQSKAHNFTEGEQAAAEGAVGRASGRSLGEKLAAAAELLRSGSADHTVLLAAQAQLLWAGLAGNCTLERTPFDPLQLLAQPLRRSPFLISTNQLAELAIMPKARAEVEYPLLSPLTAQCGLHLPIRLAWNDPQTLVDQLIRLGVMESSVTTVIASFGWVAAYTAATLNSCGSEKNVPAACAASMGGIFADLGEFAFVASSVVNSCDLTAPPPTPAPKKKQEKGGKAETPHLDMAKGFFGQLALKQKLDAEKPEEQEENPLRGWSISQCIVDLNLGVTYVGRIGIQTYFLTTECPHEGSNYDRKACALDVFNVISSIAWAAQFLSQAAVDCPENGSLEAGCAAVVSDFVAAVASFGPLVNGVADDCQPTVAGAGVGAAGFFQ